MEFPNAQPRIGRKAAVAASCRQEKVLSVLSVLVDYLLRFDFVDLLLELLDLFLKLNRVEGEFLDLFE